MTRWRAAVKYKASVIVEFETDGDGMSWRELQRLAIEAALDAGDIPDTWESVELPLVEPAT